MSLTLVVVAVGMGGRRLPNSKAVSRVVVGVRENDLLVTVEEPTEKMVSPSLRSGPL